MECVYGYSILPSIFSYLDMYDIYSCLHVNTQFYKTIDANWTSMARPVMHITVLKDKMSYNVKIERWRDRKTWLGGISHIIRTTNSEIAFGPELEGISRNLARERGHKALYSDRMQTIVPVESSRDGLIQLLAFFARRFEVESLHLLTNYTVRRCRNGEYRRTEHTQRAERYTPEELSVIYDCMKKVTLRWFVADDEHDEYVNDSGPSLFGEELLKFQNIVKANGQFRFGFLHTTDDRMFLLNTDQRIYINCGLLHFEPIGAMITQWFNGERKWNILKINGRNSNTVNNLKQSVGNWIMTLPCECWRRTEDDNFIKFRIFKSIYVFLLIKIGVSGFFKGDLKITYSSQDDRNVCDSDDQLLGSIWD